MSDELIFEGKKFVAAADAAATFGFTRDYIGILCRSGKVNGRRIGRNWYVDEQSLKSFLVLQEHARAQRRKDLSVQRVEEYKKAHELTPVFIPAVQRMGASLDGVRLHAQQVVASAAARVPEETARVVRHVHDLTQKSAETIVAHTTRVLEKTVDGVRLPAGVSAEMLKVAAQNTGAHAPLYTVTPFGELMHKAFALTLAVLLTFGTYSLIDPTYLRLAGTAVRDSAYNIGRGVADIRKSGEHTVQVSFALAQVSPAAAASSVFDSVPDMAAQVARTLNARINNFVFAVAFPGFTRTEQVAPHLSRGTVAVHIVQQGTPDARTVQTATMPSSAQTRSSTVASGPTTVINQPVIDRVVETQRIVVAGGITEEILTNRLQSLENALTSKMFGLTSANSTAISQSYNVIAQTNRIDTLDSVDITNSTFDHGTITNSTINGVTIANATLSGTTTVETVVVSSSATSTFAGGIDLSGGCVSVNGICLGQGGAGNPGGGNTQVQFNDGGVFNGAASFTFNTGTGVVSATGVSTTIATATSMVALNATSTNLFSSFARFNTALIDTLVSTVFNVTDLVATNSTTTNLNIGNTISGAGLTSCSAAGEKLLWNASTRQFSCGTDLDSGSSGFSTTSAVYFSSVGLAFSTTSATYFASQNVTPSFSTTSADYYKSQNNFHSTTSFAYNLSTYSLGSFFSTTSVAYWDSTQFRWATTSSDAWLATKSTSDLAEGSNLYYTPTRVASVIAGTTTDALTEGGTNLYYTPIRVASVIAGTTTDALAEGSTNLYYTPGRDIRFSTTSADFWKTQNNFFSTTSAMAFLALNQGAAFSTTSAAYFTAAGLSFSTTSASYFASQNQGALFSTTSAAYHLSTIDKGYFFSTTSASAFLALNDQTFSTTSAEYYKSQNNFHSTTSFAYNLSTYSLGSFFSTTSVAYWDSTQFRWATTSSDAWLATKSTTNLAEGSNLYYTPTRVASVIAGTTTDALAEGSTNLYYTPLRVSSVIAGTTTDALAEGGTNLYYTPARDIRFSTTSADYFSSFGLAFSTTSNDYWLTTKSLSAFSTTSADYWKTQNNFFSTTSANAWSALGLGYSTTSTAYNLSTYDKGFFFSTTSVAYWDSTQFRWATTSAHYASDVWAQGSTTLAKTYANNTFTGSTTFTSNVSLASASTTNLNVFGTFSGAGLVACAGSSDKLTWDASTRQFGCGTDAGAGGGITTIGAQYSSSQNGASQTFATSSDTNIGLIITSSGNTHTFTPTWTGTLAVDRGGTGANTFSYGLVGSNGGTGALANFATSTLAINTDDLVEGSSNLFYTPARDIRFSTTSADYYTSQNNFFSTTSAVYLSSVGLSFSTTSANYNLSTYDKGFFFSTTSVAYWESTQFRWATTSSDAWLATKSTSNLAEGSNLYYTPTRVASVIAGTTTDALAEGSTNLYYTPLRVSSVIAGTTTDALAEGVTNLYYTPARDIRFSTTSASYFSSFGLAFSTTSTDYYKSVNNFFSTTSASHFSSLGLAFSTTSASAFLALNQGNAFSTTSANYNLSTYDKAYFFSTTSVAYWDSTQFRWATTSSDAWLATKSTSDLAEGSNLYYTSARATSSFIALINSTTTDALAEGVTNLYYTPARDIRFSTTSASYFTANGLSFSTTSNNYWASLGLGHSTTSVAYQLSQNVTLGNATSTTLSTTVASTSALFVSNLSNVLLNTGANGAVQSTAFSGPLSFNNGTLTISQATAGQDGYLASADWTNFNSRLSTTSLGLIDKGFFFSTTSAAYFASQNVTPSFSTTSALFFASNGLSFSTTSEDYYKSQNNFHSTTSFAYNLSTYSLGSFFSTTSVAYWDSTQFRWATTSSDAWLATKSTSDLAEGSNLYYTPTRVASVIAGTTTDALAEGVTNLYYTPARDIRFSTTSANYFTSLGLAFSTTSTDYWKTQNNFHSTTSVAYQLTQPIILGNATATNFFATTASSTNAFATTALFNNATTSNFNIANTISGAGLVACAGSSDKLIWDASTRQFGCGTDAGAGGGITTIGAQYSSSQNGASQTFATSSDTNIGLVITSSGNTHTFAPTWTGTLAVDRGGTGASTFSYGLVGSNGGNGALTNFATSTLGLISTDIAEGSNLYYTPLRVASVIAGTTTDALAEGATNLYYTPARDIRFSTTSANYFTSVGLAFSTTSTDYWKTQNNFFSTTSANAWSALGLGYSTTSAAYNLSTYDKGYFFSTTSVAYWDSTQFRWATTSSDAWLATKSTSDLAEGSNLYYTSARATSSFIALINSTTTDALAEGSTNLYYTPLRVSTVIAGTTTDALAEGVTNLYYTPARDIRFSTTSASYFTSVGLSFSTTSSDYWKTQNNFHSTTSVAYQLSQNVTLGNATSTTLSTNVASTSALFVSNLSNVLLNTGANGAVQSTAFSGPLSFNNGTLTISQANGAGTNGYLSSTDWTSFNSRLSTSTIALIDKGFFFSTTSTDYWKTQNNFHSTTSFAYNLSTYSLGSFFSTTSVAYWDSTQFRWATTSSDAWLATKSTTNLAEGTNLYYTSARATSSFIALINSTTTDALAEGVTNLYYTPARDIRFSTTSADYFSSFGLAFSTTSNDYWLTTKSLSAFSTTSADYWKTQNNFFSTTSANAWSALGLGYSTTSTAYNLSTYDKGFFFSTTSVAYWDSTQFRWATTSSDAWLATKTTDNLAEGVTNQYYHDSLVNDFINGSTSIPKTFASNTFTGSNVFSGGTTIDYASTTALTVSTALFLPFGSAITKTDAAGQLVAASAGTDYLTPSTQTVRLDGNVNMFSSLNVPSSVTSGNYNVALGYQALPAITSGQYNVALGINALQVNADGSNNVALGLQTLQNNVSGWNNVALGPNALQVATGSNNVGIGSGAGSNLVSGDNNIAIGFNTAFTSTSSSNQLNIGNTIYGNLASGRIGIGVTNPSVALDVSGTASSTGLTISSVTNALLNTDASGAVQSTAFSGPLSFNNGTLTITQANGAGQDGYLAGADWTSFNSRLSTSTLDLIDKGFFFSTTSAAYYASQNVSASFSTTSANFWATNGLAFSTTSEDYYKSQNNFHSTTSFAYNLSTYDNGSFFSTTSVAYWDSTQFRWATTSSDAWLATKSTSNLAEGNNLYYTSARATSSFIALINSTTTDALAEGSINLYFTPLRVASVIAGTTTDALAEGSTNLYYTPARDIRFSTTSASYFSSFGLAFSTTSSDYWKTQNNFFSTTSALFYSSVGLAHSTTSVAYQLNQTPVFSSGFIAQASSTIGNGTTSGGLTILGNATTTGNLLVQGSATSTALNVTVFGVGGNYYTSLTGNGLQNVAGVLTVNQGQAFSTTSSDFWKTQNNFHSTTSFAYNLSTYSLGSFFSTTSVAYWDSTQFRWATTSSDAWLATKSTSNLAEGSNLYYTSARATSSFITLINSTTTDALAEGVTNLYYTPARDIRFSTTSANYFTSVGLSFSTTSSDYWSSVGLGHSTTSTAYQLSQNVTLGNATSTTLSTGIASTSALFVSNLSNVLLNTAANGAVQSTSFGGPLSFNNGTLTISQANGAGTNGYLSSTDWTSFNSRLSTTTAQTLAGQGLFHSTTSVAYQLSQNVTLGNATSTTFFATTASSSNLFSNTGTFGSTTIGSLTTVGTTTGANGFNIAAGCFAINGVCQGNDGAFSTTSASYFSSLGLAFSTTSAAYNLSTYSLGSFFSTTSVNYWETTQFRWATTSSDAWLATKSTSNLAEGSNLYYTSARATSSFITLINSTTTDALAEGSTNLYFTPLRVASVIAGTTTDALAEGVTNLYYTPARDIRFSTTSANYFTSVGLSFSTTSSDYWSSVGLGHSTTSTAYQLSQNVTLGNATSTTLSTGIASTSALFVSNLSNVLLNTAANGAVQSTSFGGPLSFNNGTLTISQANGAGTNGYLSSTDWTSFNSRLSTSTIALIDKGFFFSTTSNNFWSSVGLGYSTTSTLADLTSYNKGFFFSTTSANAFAAAGLGYSTTSSNFWSSVGLGHSTTSVAYQLTQPVILGNATSTNLFATLASSTNLFATHATTSNLGITNALTISGSATSTLGNVNATRINFTATSTGALGFNIAAGCFAINGVCQGNDGAFSTTSASYFSSLGLAFSTTSADVATNAFIHASTTIPKTYTSNTFTGTNSFQNITATGATSTTLSTGIASTSALFVSNLSNVLLNTAANGAVQSTSFGGPLSFNNGTLTISQANGAGTNGYLSSTDWTSFNSRLSTTTAQTLAGQGLFHSTTSVAYQLSQNVTLGNATSTTFFATTASSSNLFSNTGTFGSTTIGSLTTVGTTTGANGFNIAAGCFAINGVCQGNDGAFSTTSASYFSSLGLAFSTTSNNYWSSVGLGYSTTSTLADLTSYNKGFFFSTTSNNYWSSLGLGHSTTSVAYQFTQTPVMTNGFTAFASSTIGDGTATGGLTIFGGATTTGNAYFASNIGVGTSTPNFGIDIIGGNTVAHITNNNAWTGANAPLWIGQTGSAGAIVFSRASDGLPVGKIGYLNGSESGIFDIQSNGGSGEISFTTAGAERGRITTTGDFGIGTSTPNAKLSIFAAVGDTNTALFNIASSTGVATTTLFSVSNTGSTTIANGVNITSGCYAVNGTCLSTNGVADGTFSTTSASYFASLGLAFSTTSNDYWSSVGLGHSTTSVAYQLTQPVILGDATSTTFFATTASTTNFFANASTFGSSTIGALTVKGTALFENGLTSLASSTIGNGAQTTGLTIFGGATTTGTAYFAGNIGIGTTTPFAKLAIVGSAGLSTTSPLFQIASSSDLAGGAYATISSRGFLNLKGRAIDPEFVAEEQGTTPGTTLNGAIGVFVSGNYAYMTNSGRDSLAVIDISNPADPVFIAEELNPSFISPGPIYVSGKYAYVVDSTRDALFIIDISNPADPVFIAEERGPVPGTTLDLASGVFVSGNYAYVTSNFRDSLAVIDISNPADPIFIAEERGTTPGTTLNGAAGVFVSGNYAYVTTNIRDSLAVIDISNPADPVFIAEEFGPTPGTSLNAANDIFVSGKYAYVTNFAPQSSVAVIDISNPADPVFIAEEFGPTPGTSLSGADGIFVSGNTAYVANAGRDSLAIIDVSNPADPVFVAEERGTTPGTTLDNTNSVFVSGNYAYMTSLNRDSLAVIDVGGATISNLAVGTAKVGNLAVDGFAQFARDGMFGGTLIAQGIIFGNQGGSFLRMGTTSPIASTTLAWGSSVVPPALSATVHDASVAGITDVFSLTHTATGTITNGVGTGMLFNTQTYCSLADCVGATSTATTTARIASIFTTVSTSSPASALSFSTKGSSVGLTEWARLTSTGNLGLGTSTPGSNLSVFKQYGNTNATLFDIASSTNAIGSTNTSFLSVSSSGFGTTTLSGLNVSGSATSTSNVGFNITSGCYAVNGTCLSAGAADGTFSTTSASYFSSLGLAFSTTSNNYWSSLGLGHSTTSVAYQLTQVPALTGGFTAYASSTIGNGTALTGLTINGGATTTGNAYFGGTSLSIGSTTPFSLLTLSANNGTNYPGNNLLLISSSTANSIVNHFAVDNTGRVTVGNVSAVSSSTQLSILSGTTSVTRVGSTRLASGLSSTGASVAIQGRYAYVSVANGNSLQIIDISNPNVPLTKSTLSLYAPSPNNGSNGISVQGRYVYVAVGAASTHSLHIIDASDPAAPVVVSRILTSGSGSGSSGDSVYVAGKYAYVVSGRVAATAFQIFDVSNPTNPVLVGRTSVANAAFAGASVFVQGRYAYIVEGSGTTNAFQVFDVANPASIVLVGQATLANGGAGVLHSLYVQGRYAYVAESGGATNAFQIIDVSTSTVPTVVGQANLSSGTTNTGAGIFVQGRYAYITEGDDATKAFKIFDVSNPTAPVLVSQNAVAFGSSLLTGIAVQGRYAYIANGGGAAAGFEVFDLGGAYIQQLETGGLETGTLSVRNTIQAGDGIFWGGLRIQQSLDVNGGGNFLTHNFATTSSAFSFASSTALSATAVDTNVGAVSDVLSLTHFATSTSAAGIGTGLLFNDTLLCSLTNCVLATTTATSTARIATVLTSVSTTSPAADLAFFTKGSASGLTEWARLTSAGNLGIGTSTPTSNLGILKRYGNTNATLFSIASSTNVAGSTNTSFLSVSATGFGTTTLSGLNISGSATSTSNVGYNITTGCYAINGTCVGGGSGSPSGSDGQVQYKSGSSFAGASQLWIGTSNNNVGVGSSTPFAKFSINANSGETNSLLFQIASSSGASTSSIFSISNKGIFDFGIAATTTIVNNNVSAWSIATSSTGASLFRIDTTAGAEQITIGSSGSDVTIGAVGTAANLVFEENSTIKGQSGGRTLTFGGTGDKINFAVNTGVGTSTPLANLSIFKAYGDTNSLVFSIASSTNSVGGTNNTLFSVSATTTGALDYVRVAIGTSTGWGSAGVLDQLTVAGRMYSTWRQDGCDLMNSSLAVTTSVNNYCGGFGLISNDGGVAVETVANNNNAFYPSVALQVGRAATDAANEGSRIARNVPFVAASSSPVVEVWLQHAPLGAHASTSPFIMVGFNNQTATNLMGTEATLGAWFQASTTLANWQAIVRNGTTRQVIDTGIASSTNAAGTATPTATSTLQKMRVELTPTHARFLINGNVVATSSISMPSANLTPMITTGHAAGGAVGQLNRQRTLVSLFRFWMDDPPTFPAVEGAQTGEAAQVVQELDLIDGSDMSISYRSPQRDSLFGSAGRLVSLVATGTASVEMVTEAYSPLLFGVIANSSRVGLGVDNYETVRVATAGRTLVYVSTENGPIKVGDPITSSTREGLGMKATRPGTIVGYAVQSYDPGNGIGQCGYVDMFGSLCQSQIYVALDSGYALNAQTVAEVAVSDFSAAMAYLASTTVGTVGDLGAVVFGQITAKVAIVKDFFADKIFANRVETKELCVEDVCVSKAQFLLMVQTAGAGVATGGSGGGGGTGGSGDSEALGDTGDSGETGTTTPDTEAPVVSINGATPLIISVGDTYSDPGAVVTDNVNNNLGFTVSLDGGPQLDLSQLILDTTAAGEHTITYTATDEADNIGTATRTVIVNEPTMQP